MPDKPRDADAADAGYAAASAARAHAKAGGGLLVVLAGPSGVGKTTIRDALLARHPGEFVKSISATTRARRPGEVDGATHFYIDGDAFEARAAAGGFLEHAAHFGSRYGTPRDFIERTLADDKVVLLDIDICGADQLASLDLPLLRVFLAPPDADELETRLRGRGEPGPSMERRLARAREEMSWADRFDVTVVNDEVDSAVAAVERAILAARPA